MIIALFMASLNLRPAINSISPILDSIRNDLGMSASLASLLTSIPVLCMGIFSPAAAKLGGRWGIERVICWSLALIGIGTILRLFTNSTVSLLITAFLAGLGIAAVGPLLSGFIKRYFPAKVPAMIAVYTTALTIGAALASGFSAPLLDGVQSWQGVLSLWSIFAFLAVPVWWFVTRRVEPQDKLSNVTVSAAMPWGNPKAWLLTLSFGFMSMIFYSVTAWLPPIVQDLGYNKSYAGTALTVFVFVQIPAGLILPALLRRFPSRMLWMLVGSGMELIGFAMLAFSMLPWLAALLIGLGAGIIFPINLLLPIDVTSDAQESASWAAMTQSFGFIIGASGPLLLGWIHDVTRSFFLAIIVMIAIVALMMVVQTASGLFISPKKA